MDIVVTVTTGMYAGCSATFTPNGSDVTLSDAVCGEPPADTPIPETVN